MPVLVPEPPVQELVEIPLIGVKLPRTVIHWLIAAFASLLLLGWFFLRALPAVWFGEEGYYSHGLLIPFMALAVIYARRDRIKSEPVGSSKAGLAVMILGLLLLVASRLIDNLSLAALAFILAIIGGIYFAFGGRVGRHCLSPVLFLLFMMPVLGWFIDVWTNPLQRASTRVAEKMLSIAGYGTDMSPAQPTLIHMDHYQLLVGGPCSGFKLILSLFAFATFFVMISNLGLKRNLLLIALTFPLALVINGLRIMLIGVVGEGASGDGILASFGNWLVAHGDGKKDAGMVFHDYSGYLTLIVCFIILHYIVKALEKKKEPDAVAS